MEIDAFKSAVNSAKYEINPSKVLQIARNPPALGRRRVLSMWLVCSLSYVESICNKESVSGASFCLV